MTRDCSLSKIFLKSSILASTIDAPIAAVVAPIDVPDTSRAGAAILTFGVSFINYSIRQIFRECEIPYLEDKHPYIGSILAGSVYYGIIDFFSPAGVSFKSLFEGSTRQLAYEVSLNHWPLNGQIGANLTSALVIETGQSLIEGHGIARGLAFGSYVGIIIEGLYEPLISLLGIDES
jgi:hypothetical protein